MNVPEAPFVLHLPNVMHLATDVAGVVHDASTVSSLHLAASLHPSAAVGGTPTAVAVRLIAEIEGMDRGRYAGPVGWMDATGDGEWGIALRSAEIAGDTGPALRRLRHRRRLRPRGRAGRGAGQVRAGAGLAGSRLTVPGRVVAVNVAHVIGTPVPGHGEWRDTKPPQSGIDKRPVAGRVRVEPLGLVGDSILDTANHGGLSQAVYAYASEDQEWWTCELGDELTRPITPGSFGENLTLSGVAVNDARAGERWAIGSVVLEVVDPRIPCSTFAGFMGLRGWVQEVRARRAAGRLPAGGHSRLARRGRRGRGVTGTTRRTDDP